MSADDKITDLHNGFLIEDSDAAQFLTACIREACRKMDLQIAQDGEVIDLRAFDDATLQNIFNLAVKIAAEKSGQQK